ncbi:MAG: hypothetical protein WBD01_07735 [Salaquimonas sp.]
MSKRYKYDSMTAQEFRIALNGLDMPYMEFCRLTGANERTVKKWLENEQDIPPWASLALHLFKNSPNGTKDADAWAAKNVQSDTEQPGIRYPYQKP